MVDMHYEGTLTDGTKFDASYDRGEPLSFMIGRNQVINCWDDVGILMTVGQKVKVLCPAETAYGSRAVGPIPANSDLVFTIERVKWSDSWIWQKFFNFFVYLSFLHSKRRRSELQSTCFLLLKRLSNFGLVKIYYQCEICGFDSFW